jgi:hypothetical protein
MSEESEELRERLEAVEARLAELVSALTAVHPDDVARVQAIAEDGLARATNAQSIAEDALGRAAKGEARSEDALARADDAGSLADQALQLVADAQAGAENAAAAARAGAEDAAATAQAGAENAAAAARAGAEDAAATAQAGAENAAAAAQARAEDAAATATLALATVRDASLPVRVAAFDTWLELCPPVESVPISIVLPTRDRPALLPRAVASVLVQLYPRWELIVVDDGDTDAVAEALGEVEDERVRVVEGPRRGLSAARNAGLDAATGDVVCYLDDDNTMHPRWLLAVASVFAGGRDDEVDVAYGVTLVEYLESDSPAAGSRWPWMWQLPWSRELLLERNVADAGALAHRRGLPDARFDESLSTGEDWDLLIRLTADRAAIPIPALSHAYTLSGPDRMSRAPGHEPGLEQIRRRHAGR